MQFSRWHKVFKAQDVTHRNILLTLKSNACKDSLRNKNNYKGTHKSNCCKKHLSPKLYGPPNSKAHQIVRNLPFFRQYKTGDLPSWNGDSLKSRAELTLTSCSGRSQNIRPRKLETSLHIEKLQANVFGNFWALYLSMGECDVAFVPVFAFNHHLHNTNRILKKTPDSSRKHSYKRDWCPFSSLVSSYFWCKGQLRVTICMLAVIFTHWLTFNPSFTLHLPLLVVQRSLVKLWPGMC